MPNPKVTHGTGLGKGKKGKYELNEKFNSPGYAVVPLDPMAKRLPAIASDDIVAPIPRPITIRLHHQAAPAFLVSVAHTFGNSDRSERSPDFRARWLLLGCYYTAT